MFDINKHIVIRNFFTKAEGLILEESYDFFIELAEAILINSKYSIRYLEEYYISNSHGIITVPEKDNPKKICRFENFSRLHRRFENTIVERVQDKLFDLTNHSFTLFKDKCNIKSPGGGEFSPHQDFPAYSFLPPTFHITAALFIDDATVENGCLQMASNYLDFSTPKKVRKDTIVGHQYIFNHHLGGERNGEILDDIQNHLSWELIEGESGDLVFFNSYIPHKSSKNRSPNHRRMYFLTFNYSAEGSHYEAYYRLKRLNYSNPIFHVATPTQHNNYGANRL